MVLRALRFPAISVFLIFASLSAQPAATLRELAGRQGTYFGSAVGGVFPGDTAYTRMIRQECSMPGPAMERGERGGR